MENSAVNFFGRIKSSFNRRTISILSIIAVAIAIPLTVLTSQQQQDIRQRASEPPPVITSQTINLSPGNNLIGLSVIPLTSYYAEDFLTDLNSTITDVQVSSISRFDSQRGRYEIHALGSEANNFQITTGQGYFVKSSGAGTATISGYDSSSTNVNLQISKGWSLISLPVVTTSINTADSLLQEMGRQGIQTAAINRWYGGRWESHTINSPANNFSIAPGEGYYIRNTGTQKTFTLTVAAAPTPTPAPTAATPTPISSTTPTPTPAPTTTRVFVTSTAYNGDLGGLTGADAKCQERANSANLGGTWKAWLSDMSTSVSSRLEHNPDPYKLLNNTTIANNWSDLTDGSLSTTINLNENQTRVGDVGVWTGSSSNGNIQQADRDGSCNSWSTQSYRGSAGFSRSFGIGWTNSGDSPCYYSNHLYCFEQTNVIPLSTPTPTPTPTPTSTPTPSPTPRPTSTPTSIPSPSPTPVGSPNITSVVPSALYNWKGNTNTSLTINGRNFTAVSGSGIRKRVLINSYAFGDSRTNSWTDTRIVISNIYAYEYPFKSPYVTVYVQFYIINDYGEIQNVSRSNAYSISVSN